MSRELHVFRWYAGFSVAMVFACAVSVIWSVQEALSFHHSGVHFLQMWSATGVAAAIVAAIATLVSGALATILLHPKVGPAILRQLPEGHLFQWVLFLLIVSFGILLALWLFQTMFASIEVQRLAMALSGPVLVLMGAGVARAAYPLAIRWSRAARARFTDSRAVGVFLIAMVLVWLIGLGTSTPDVVVNLRPRDLLPIVATFVAAWLGAMFLRPGRWTYWGALPCAFLLAGLSAYFLVFGYENNTRIAVSKTTHGAKLVHWQLTLLTMGDKPIGQPTGSCFLNVSPAKAEKTGKVRSRAPDIVVLLVDGLQWNHTSMGGYERNTTPNLLRLGKNAAVFRAYSPATSTRQSIRAFFSGVFPSQVAIPRGGKWGVTFVEGQETIASYLQAAGYETVAVDSTRGIFRNAYNALHGFDVVDSAPYKFSKKNGYSTPMALERVRAHLSRPRMDNKPRFIWAQLMDTHPPFPGGPDPIIYGRTQMDKYDGAIHFLDRELAETVDFIRDPARGENTFLLLSADHGNSFHKKRLVHVDVYDSGIQVPLMIWGPNVEGKRYQARVSLLDVYATVFGMAGLPIPRSTCGVNLLPDIQKGTAPSPADVYVEQIPDHTRKYFDVAFIRDDMKLILRPSSGVRELYDLKRDPEEQKNLAKKHPQKLSAMLSALRQYYGERNFSPERYGLEK